MHMGPTGRAVFKHVVLVKTRSGSSDEFAAWQQSLVSQQPSRLSRDRCRFRPFCLQFGPVLTAADRMKHVRHEPALCIVTASKLSARLLTSHFRSQAMHQWMHSCS